MRLIYGFPLNVGAAVSSVRIDWSGYVVLREPLRYAPGSRGNACARPASSRIRSGRSSGCNHHLSKSIRTIHRVYVVRYSSLCSSCDLGDTPGTSKRESLNRRFPFFFRRVKDVSHVSPWIYFTYFATEDEGGGEKGTDDLSYLRNKFDSRQFVHSLFVS